VLVWVAANAWALKCALVPIPVATDRSVVPAGAPVEVVLRQRAGDVGSTIPTVAGPDGAIAVTAELYARGRWLLLFPLGCSPPKPRWVVLRWGEDELWALRVRPRHRRDGAVRW
jgi:hypothetical protein